MSILLQNSGINQLIIGGALIEEDDSAAVTSWQIDFKGHMLSIGLKKGTVRVNGVDFSPGNVVSGNVTIMLNFITGVWTVNGSALTGTLNLTALGMLQNQILNDRNAFETFAANQSIMPGTQISWKGLK